MVKMTELTGRAYAIQDDVPVPGPYMRPDHAMAYETARRLKVGQSFVIPKQRSGITANLARATGFKFTQRTEGDNMRIWRIE